MILNTGVTTGSKKVKSLIASGVDGAPASTCLRVAEIPSTFRYLGPSVMVLMEVTHTAAERCIICTAFHSELPFALSPTLTSSFLESPCVLLQF